MCEKEDGVAVVMAMGGGGGRKEKEGAVQVGSECNSAVYGSRLFCTSKYTEEEYWVGEGVAAGHFTVIVFPGSCGSAQRLGFLFFCFPPFPFLPFSPVISSGAAENAVDIRAKQARQTPLYCSESKTPDCSASCPSLICSVRPSHLSLS